MLNPLGMAGSLVILIILAIICIIVITEKSFIKGIRNSGERIVSEARKDYSEYKEHSNRVRMAQKEAREEASANARMNNVVRGVTNDLTIYDDNRNEGSDIDITEIEAVDNEDDMYSDDIYDPLITPMPRISREPVWELHVDSASEENISTHQDNAEDNIIKNAADGSDDMYKSEDNGLGEIIQSTANTDIEDKANSGTENIVNSYAENTADSSAESSKQYKFPPVSLLNRNTNSKASNLERENRDTAITLKQTLQNFGVKVDITDISCGPSVTRYELKPELGVKVSRIVSLADDIKLSLAI